MEILRNKLPLVRSSSPEPPLLQDYIAYSDGRIMCIAKQEDFKTKRDFHFDEHLFSLHFEEVHPTHKDFTVESSLYAIEKSVSDVLSVLQEYYVRRTQGTDPATELGQIRREHSHQCFIVVSSGGFKSETFKKKNIVIGSFDIEQSSPRLVANFLCSKLKRILNQYSDRIMLSDNFLVRFRCIGGPLIKRNVEERNFQKDKEKYNLENHQMEPFEPFPERVEGESRKKRSPRYLWKTPLGFLGDEECFKDKCVFTCLAVAHALSQLQKYKTHGRPKPSKKVFFLAKYFSSRKSRPQQKVGLYLKERVELLEKNFGTVSNVQELFREVAKAWKMQLVIYDREANMVGSFPAEISLKGTLSFFLLTKHSSSLGHLQIISDFPKWVRIHGFECFLPNCEFKSKFFLRRRHICRTNIPEVTTCFKCRRYKLPPASLRDLPLEKESKDFFFCRSIKFEQSLKCDKCNLIAGSKSCLTEHKKICSYTGYMCLACNKYLHGTQKTVKLSHVCGTEVCHTCFKPLPLGQSRSEHLCSWATPKGKSEMANVAFANVLLPSSATSATCLKCFEKGQSVQQKCLLHKAEGLETLSPVCTLLYERDVHENWASACFTDECIPSSSFRPPALLPYIPDDIRHSLPNLDLSKKTSPTRFNNLPKKSQTLEEEIERLKMKSPASALQKLLSFLCNEIFRNFNIFVSSFEELNCIMGGLIENGIMPTGVLYRDGKTMKFKLPYFNITFQCFKTHVDLNLWEMCGTEELAFFPHAILFSNQWLDIRAIPPLHFFLQLDDDDQLRDLKTSFWNRRKEAPWDAASQLIESCISNVIALARVALEYLAIQMKYQSSCIRAFGFPQHLKEGDLPFCHPFEFCSNTSYIFETFRQFQERGQLKIIRGKHQFRRKTKCSRVEFEAIKWLQDSDSAWIGEFSHGTQVRFATRGKGEKFKIITEADGYHPYLKIAFFFNGCFFHGCDEDNCPTMQRGNVKTLNAKFEKFQKTAERLLTTHPQHVEQIWYIQECTFNQLKKSDPVLREFCRQNRHRPTHHFSFRECLSSQIEDVYILRWEATEHERMRSVDCNDLFSGMAMQEMAYGDYSIFMLGDEDQRHVRIDESGLYYHDCRVNGLALVRVFAPQDLFIARLSVKIENMTLGVLCYQCAINTLKKKQQYRKCRHKEFSRSFVGSYSIIDILSARRFGYKFVFYELVSFEKMGPILRPFVTSLMFQKQRFSGYPTWCKSETDRQRFLSHLNEYMQYEKYIGQSLTTANVTPNAQLKAMTKRQANAFFGYFSLRTDKFTSTVFLNQYDKIAKLVNAKSVKNLESYNGAMRVTKRPLRRRENLKSNCMIGIQVTSYARTFMFDHLMRLIAAGAKIHRVHTDSIEYSIASNAEELLPIGPATLQFKHEYGEIESFAAVGVNSISVKHRDDNGDKKVSFKLGGFQQRHELSSDLTHESIVRVIEATIRREAAAASGESLPEEPAQIKLQNIRSINRGPHSVKERRQFTVEVSSALKRRQLPKPFAHPFVTFPYGYLPTAEATHRCVNPYVKN